MGPMHNEVVQSRQSCSAHRACWSRISKTRSDHSVGFKIKGGSAWTGCREPSIMSDIKSEMETFHLFESLCFRSSSDHH